MCPILCHWTISPTLLAYFIASHVLPEGDELEADVYGVFSDIKVERGRFYFIENRRLYTGNRETFWMPWAVSYTFAFPDRDTIEITDMDDTVFVLQRQTAVDSMEN